MRRLPPAAVGVLLLAATLGIGRPGSAEADISGLIEGAMADANAGRYDAANARLVPHWAKDLSAAQLRERWDKATHFRMMKSVRVTYVDTRGGDEGFGVFAVEFMDGTKANSTDNVKRVDGKWLLADF